MEENRYILYWDASDHRQVYPNIALGEKGLTTDLQAATALKAIALQNGASHITTEDIALAQEWLADCPKCAEFVKSI